jgi:hypothetical protein
MISRVRLQTLFRENPRYFIVTVSAIDLRLRRARGTECHNFIGICFMGVCRTGLPFACVS